MDVISSGGIPDGEAPMWICPACNGTGRAPDNVTPLTRNNLDPHRTCLLCKGAKKIPTVLPVEHPFTDARGSIQNIVHEPVGSVVVITSKAGTVRAQHWHRTDWHLCYVLSGRIRYVEMMPVKESAGETGPLEAFDGRSLKLSKWHFGTFDPTTRAEYIIPAGWLFYTPSLVAHAMFFEEDTVFLTLGNRSRTPEDHENDLVRLAEKDWLR